MSELFRKFPRDQAYGDEQKKDPKKLYDEMSKKGADKWGAIVEREQAEQSGGAAEVGGGDFSPAVTQSIGPVTDSPERGRRRSASRARRERRRPPARPVEVRVSSGEVGTKDGPAAEEEVKSSAVAAREKFEAAYSKLVGGSSTMDVAERTRTKAGDMSTNVQRVEAALDEMFDFFEQGDVGGSEGWQELDRALGTVESFFRAIDGLPLEFTDSDGDMYNVKALTGSARARMARIEKRRAAAAKIS